MTAKTLLTALALSLAPAMGLAAGCNWDRPQSASQCADGQIWDAELGSCVQQITS